MIYNQHREQSNLKFLYLAKHRYKILIVIFKYCSFIKIYFSANIAKKMMKKLILNYIYIYIYI